MDFTGERYVPALAGQIKYEHLHRYALCLELVAGKSVLDIASGEGYGAALLASVAKSVTGVDIDATSVEHAKHLYYKPNLSFLVGSCESVPQPDNSFDVVTSFETIEHHGKHEEMLDEIKRVLKPGGTLIISSPNRLTYSDEPGYKNPFHVKELYYDEFYELLHRRFKSIRMFGQRLAAGSFVFPLGTSGGSDFKSLTGDAHGVDEHIRELPSPIYFVAVCSDDTQIAERDISSVYLDRIDDLLKTLEQERLRDIRQMQEQVRRTEEEIGCQKTAYEAEIGRLNEELRAARVAYEAQILRQTEELGDTRANFIEQLRQRDAVITNRDEAIIQRDDAIAQLRAHWAASEKNIRNQAEHIRTYERLLSDAQTNLGRHIEVLNWIYASRSWRIGNALRQVERLNERLSHNEEIFKGQLDLPQGVIADSFEIRGWVYSTAAPVILVEAFIGDFYLGGVQHGEDRPGIPEAPLQCGYSARISLHGFNLTGERTLRIRVYDQKGNKRVFTRELTISAASGTHAEPLVPIEIFQGKLEFPEAGSSTSDSLEVTGWMYSKAAPIIFIEAFLNESYLGRVSYGVERPDVLTAFPMEAPLRCGYDKVFSLNETYSTEERTLKLRFYDSQGNTYILERVIRIQASTVGAVREAQARQREASNDRPPLQAFEQIIAQFVDQFGRDPSILDWKSGLDLAAFFPNLPVFSPPSASEAENILPYLDHTIDMVVIASSDPAPIAEARRVSAAAVVRLSNSDSLDVEWQFSGEEKPAATVSIIIPVYNEMNYTESCLEQLRKTLPQNFRGEIIVVDDASSDETPAVLKRFAETDERIKVLRNPENAGFIASCNRGAKEASGEVIVFLNNDTLPVQGWLPPLLRVLRDKPGAGAVGGKLVYPDGTLQEAGGVIFSDGSGCNFGKHEKAPNAPLYNFLREVDYCSGALLATRRALFLELGGFDTRFQPAYYEDADYCFSLRARGYRVYYQPESVIVHFEGASSGTDITTGIKSYQAVNRGKFVEKWSDILTHQPPPPQRYDFATLHYLSLSRSLVKNGHGN
jgi:GT2 family glycosyltransferase/ubiquinone/menaquinone biosynthesis C-methylase UbiE